MFAMKEVARDQYVLWRHKLVVLGLLDHCKFRQTQRRDAVTRQIMDEPDDNQDFFSVQVYLENKDHFVETAWQQPDLLSQEPARALKKKLESEESDDSWMLIDKAPQSIKPVDTFSDLFKARSFPKKRSELGESGD